MEITVNKIYQDKGDETTKTIENMYNSKNRVLFIVDERDSNVYNIDEQFMASLKFHSLLECLNFKRIVLTPSKFTLLSWQNFISSTNYDLIIIRLIDMKPEFIHAFRTFYFRTDVMCLEKAKVVTYLKDIKDDSSVYLQSVIDEGKEVAQQGDRNTLRCISVTPVISREVMNYVKVRKMIKSKKDQDEKLQKFDDLLSKMEEESLMDAVKHIDENIDLSKLSSIETTQEMIDHANNLLRKLEHKSIIRRYLEEGNVLVHGQSPGFSDNPNVHILLKLKKEQIKDMSTLSTLIIIDDFQPIANCEECEFNQHFINFLKKNPNRKSDEIVPIDINLDITSIPVTTEKETSKNCFIHEILTFRYKNVVYVKNQSEFPEDFVRSVISNNTRDLKGFVKYYTRERVEYLTSPKGAIISLDYAVLLLEHIIHLICKCLEKYFLFLKSPRVTRTYENTEDGGFICILELPLFATGGVFSSQTRSKGHVLKKDACKEASYEAIVRLHKEGFLDNKLCPIPEVFVFKSDLYFERIKAQYGIDTRDVEDIRKKIEEILPTYGDEPEMAFEKFKKANYIDLKEKKIQVSVDEILRKQPECFKKFDDKFCVYQFDDGNLGLACSGGFEETVKFRGIKIEYLKTTTFTEKENELILFYQIIFFSINFRRILALESKSREYCYFVLPIKDKEINFEYLEVLYRHFLLGSVYDIKDENVLNTHLLFNPITRTFHNYLGASSLKFTDDASSMNKICRRNKSEVNKNYIKSEENSYFTNKKKKFNQENEENEVLHYEETTKKKEVEEITYLQYFERLYGVKLTNTTDDRNLIINVNSYSSKERVKTSEVHSGEVFFVTGVKNTIKKDYQNFLHFFNAFENCAIAGEFIRDSSLDVSLGLVATALSQRETNSENITDLGYERLEFIGDSVLKFSISKFLFKTRGYDLSKIVSTKDILINNSYLYSVAQNLNLKKYISLIKFNENIFQPPAILKFKECREKSLKLHKYIEVLRGSGAFSSNNQEFFVMKYVQKQASEAKVITNKKVYADIVEALIGCHYVEHGYKEAWEYIKKIKIPDLISHEEDKKETCKSKEKNSNIIFKEEVKDVLSFLGFLNPAESSYSTSEKLYLICPYDNILSLTRIKQIEEIIGYRFKNVGLLEKAVIHPSYRNNIFGSEKFQKLELVGDCFLDLKVSDYIFKNYQDAGPSDLHTLRKSLVNNYTFATILFKSGLNDLVETGLSEKHADFTNQKVSKVFSDIFEAIAGAVVLDNDFCLEKTNDFFLKMLKLMKENARDC